MKGGGAEGREASRKSATDDWFAGCVITDTAYSDVLPSRIRPRCVGCPTAQLLRQRGSVTVLSAIVHVGRLYHPSVTTQRGELCQKPRRADYFVAR